MASTSPGWTPPGRPDLGAEGTHPREPHEYASVVLREHGEAIADAITRRFYETWPSLLERYGERGRAHCHADQFWHLSTLDVAWTLGGPATFVDYAVWLRGFLAGRGMGDMYACANLVFLHEALLRLTPTEAPAAERDVLAGYLEAALAIFPPEARVVPAPPA